MLSISSAEEIMHVSFSANICPAHIAPSHAERYSHHMPRRKQITAQRSPRPAHDTKHEPELAYPFLSCTFRLRQFNDGRGNGTGLWLGSQCLSLYLEDIQPTLLKQVKSRRKLASESEGEGPKPRAIELGSGIGLGAFVYRT